MDPARVLHRLGVLAFWLTLASLALGQLAAAVGPLFGVPARTLLLVAALALLVGALLYGAGILWEVLRDGKQAAGLK